jgi:hypothetical protein
MGGIGYITTSHAGITLNNTLINAHTIKAANENSVKRFLFSSSACIYPQYLQDRPDVTPLREESAFPADPEEGYGLEKLFMEKLCQYFREDWNLSYSCCSLPQCIWSAGNLRWWPREGSSGYLPKNCSRRFRRPDPDLGRRSPDALVHVYRRLCRRYLSHHAVASAAATATIRAFARYWGGNPALLFVRGSPPTYRWIAAQCCASRRLVPRPVAA